jgi:hypothetical protein
MVRIVATLQQKRQGWLMTLKFVQLLLVLVVLFQIHTATDFGVRTRSQISSTTSKIILRWSNAQRSAAILF